MEALALKTRYKIYNHACYTAFLKEIIKESSKADEFDEIRKVRNDVNYYGKDISTEEAAHIITKIKALRIFVYNLLKCQKSPFAISLLQLGVKRRFLGMLKNTPRALARRFLTK